MIVNDRARLIEAARGFGTPLYVYDFDAVSQRFETLRAAFKGRFGISYAIKANPNPALLASICDKVDTFDASSIAEVERALAAGAPPERITFSGPAKRDAEIARAVTLGIGELVLESVREATLAGRFAVESGKAQGVLIRVNPAEAPRHFGVNMSGKASQFGIDEEDMEAAIDAIVATPGLTLLGFHIYSGSNSIVSEAVAENFLIFLRIFRRAVAHWGGRPQTLVFGAGFGLPYLPADAPIDIEDVAKRIVPEIDTLLREPAFSDCKCVLELGRWLVGPAGWLLSSVIGEKSSRGTEIRLCDAGFNTHLAAFGMMGSVIRRNWRIQNLTSTANETGVYTLVGPLCTTIDTLATKIELPKLGLGDMIAIENSGAYGITASPTAFISHPAPREVAFEDGTMRDVTGSLVQSSAASD